MKLRNLLILVTVFSTSVHAHEAPQKKTQKRVEKTNLEPVIRDDELIQGTVGGPITIVKYSDFQCQFCKRGSGIVKEVLALEKYKGKIQFIYKHMPLDFHKMALPAAKYYEALRLQDETLAISFHDNIFKKQDQLSRGVEFLNELATSLGADMSQLGADINSEEVSERIKEDLAEAKSFGFRGTPSFVVNGVGIQGAYPASHFVKIIEKTMKNK